MTVIAILFWVAAFLIVYAQVGYGLLLALISAVTRAPAPASRWTSVLPRVTIIIAAHNEEGVIAERVENLRALSYPPDRVEVIVASDGSDDATVMRALEADLVLDLPRGGKIRAQDAAVARASGDLVAFSDANSVWAPDALSALVDAFADPRIGYACGSVSLLAAGGDNQEGLYWRYEMWLRRLESRLSSITAGNGAIYATRAETYLRVDPCAGQDLAFPFQMVKRGWRAVYVPEARAWERMAPSMDGEFARKRRMAGQVWPSGFGEGMLSPRGYGPLYALMILSHRVLRYVAWLLHLVLLATSVALTGHGLIYVAAVAIQVLFLAAGVISLRVSWRPAMLARYYIIMNAALAAGMWDYFRGARSPIWETVPGTR